MKISNINYFLPGIVFIFWLLFNVECIQSQVNNLKLVFLESKNLYGYQDENGKQIVPYKYTYAEQFNNEYAIVKNEKNKYGIINKVNKVICPFIYDYIRLYNATQSVYVVFKGKVYNGDINQSSGKYGLLNKDL